MKAICISAVFFILLLNGCYTPHFLPNTVPAPFFENSGNVRAGFYAGTNSYDAHLAVSPLQHIGIVGSYSYSSSSKVKEDKPDTEAEFTHGHKYFEGALGFYTTPIPMGKSLFKSEIFVGYGKGTTSGSLNEGKKNWIGMIVPTTQVDANYLQYYVQMNVSMTESNVLGDTRSNALKLEYGTIFRFSRTGITNYSRFGQDLGIPSTTFNCLQIAASLSTVSTLKFTCQSGWLFILSKGERPAYSPFYVTVGIGLSLW
jgi:hypothetical protein